MQSLYVCMYCMYLLITVCHCMYVGRDTWCTFLRISLSKRTLVAKLRNGTVLFYSYLMPFCSTGAMVHCQPQECCNIMLFLTAPNNTIYNEWGSWLADLNAPPPTINILTAPSTASWSSHLHCQSFPLGAVFMFLLHARLCFRIFCSVVFPAIAAAPWVVSGQNSYDRCQLLVNPVRQDLTEH